MVTELSEIRFLQIRPWMANSLVYFKTVPLLSPVRALNEVVLNSWSSCSALTIRSFAAAAVAAHKLASSDDFDLFPTIR